MIVAVVLAGVLVVVLTLVAIRLRRETARADAAQAENARLVAELMRRERDVTELTPFRQRVERVPDWLWTADADGTVTYSNAAELPVGTKLESLGWAGVIKRGERIVDTRSIRTDEGWLGIDRDLTEAVPARVAVVRRPVVDGRREVVGYELVGDGSVLAGVPAGRARRARGRPAVVAEPGRRRLAGPGRSARCRSRPTRRPSGRRRSGRPGSRSPLDGYAGPSPLLEHCTTVKVNVNGRSDEALQALIAEPGGTRPRRSSPRTSTTPTSSRAAACSASATSRARSSPARAAATARARARSRR